MQPVSLSTPMYQLTGLGQFTALHMLQYMLSYYWKIDKIDLKDNAAKMMGTYDSVEPFDCLINQLKKGREFARAGKKMIADAMMVPNGISLLEQTATLTNTFGNNADNTQNSRHGQVSKCSYIKSIENKEEHHQLQGKEGKTWKYRISMACRHSHQKSTT